MRFLLAAALLTGVLFSAACGYLEEVETEDIVSTIPWADEEQSQYVIVSLSDPDTELGSGTLSVSKTNGEYELVVDFANEEGTDVATVLELDIEAYDKLKRVKSLTLLAFALDRETYVDLELRDQEEARAAAVEVGGD